jgi:hypothetical protein
MRRKSLRAMVAGFGAAMLVVAGGTQPASAVTADEISKYLDIANKAVTLVKNILGGGVSDADLKNAVAQIVAAVNTAKTQIMSHIDAITAAEVSACARHHVIEFADIDRFSTDTLQSWAQAATGCATLAQSMVGTVTDKAAADNIGLALNVVGPIALAARARAGFSTLGLIDTLRTGNLTILTAVAPACTWTSVATPVIGVFLRTYTCTAYNGEQASASGLYNRLGQPVGIPINEAQIQAQATSHTGRALAVAVLPILVV